MDVPIYGTTTRQGNASGGALIGMLLGAAGGKAVTGNDKGAAIGAIMGGLVGADKGAQPKQSQTIVGYKQELVCNDVTSVSNELVEVYSHSTIRFYIDGRRYVLKFQKQEKQMEAIIALIVGALMNGHTADQLTKMEDELTVARVEIVELESQTQEAFREMAKRDIELGTMTAGDAGRIAVLEGQVEKLQIQNKSLRQQLINLREYVTLD